MKQDTPLISTIGELCRVCYTCVRDCPAKAIRISNGQAEVLSQRCIGCGNCVRVCSQNAKKGYDARGDVKALLASPAKVAAVVAPSFPAEFADLDYRQVAHLIRALGFYSVHEVAFGADLVAAAYKKLLSDYPDRRFIATSCPGVVAYVEKYHPDTVGQLAPIVSPMIAEARALRMLHGPDLKIVFIGPCFAKKVEGCRKASARVSNEIDAVLTFVELRSMLREQGDSPPEPENADDFDPPHPNLGALFAVSRGMLQAANLEENLLSDTVMAADGRNNFVQAIKEFASGALNVQLLELLCCNGCIMGSGFTTQAPQFSRRSRVVQYVRDRIRQADETEWRGYLARLSGIDLSTAFYADDQRLPIPTDANLRDILHKMGKFKPEDELNCGACGYPTCHEHAIAIFKGLAENEMCLPNTIERLNTSLEDLRISNEQLEDTRKALINVEKLASMGQLAAGIAHEVNNPLGVILLYAKLMLEDASVDSEQYEDLKMISEQAVRCKKIVGDLLNFARKNKVMRQPANVCELIDQCRKVAQPPSKIRIEVEHKMANPVADIDKDQMIQVLTNLITNAYDAMPAGGVLSIITEDDPDNIRISIKDTGCGIQPGIMKKIFEPLFTTKQIGQGTGLGLSVTFGIIKMHCGKIDVESNADPKKGPTGTSFIISLPRLAGEV